MIQANHRRIALQTGLAWGLSMVVPAGRACEVVAANLTIVHPWTRATAQGATSAIVCMSFQDVTQADRLIGVQTPIAAGAEMAGDGARPGVNFAIREGQTTVLGETGRQLRLVGLKVALEVGRSYPMSLTFLKAGTVNASLSVDYERLA